MSTYQFDGAPIAAVEAVVSLASSAPVGCFADDKDNRMFELRASYTDAMTVNVSRNLDWWSLFLFGFVSSGATVGRGRGGRGGGGYTNISRHSNSRESSIYLKSSERLREYV